MAEATGIIWVGPVFDPGGYGSVSRNCLFGFRKINFPARVVHFGPDHRGELPPHQVELLSEMTGTDVGRNPVGIIHLPPDYYPKFKFRGVARRIGYTIFETDRIPAEWVPLCNKMDEIWVPSEFNLQTFSASGVDRRKLRVLPYGIDTGFYGPAQDALDIEGRRGFSFLYVFAFDWRKGFDLLLDAYYSEFRDTDDVSLVLKVFRPDYFPGGKDIKTLILDSSTRSHADKKGLPHVVVIDERYSLEDMRKLYNACDVYISTDRANGWGMPCMEAMAMGKAAATIDWSGSTEFMKGHNSLLMEPTGRLQPVDGRLAEARPIYTGHKWAEVTMDEVRRVMRFAYENREAVAAIAARGREDVTRDFSLEAVAAKAVGLLSDVPGRRLGLFRPSCLFRYTLRERAYHWKLKLTGTHGP